MAKYAIQQVEFESDGSNQPDLSKAPKLATICESEDMEVIMRNWVSYCSGLNDYDEPFANASFYAFNPKFYRIVKVEE